MANLLVRVREVFSRKPKQFDPRQGQTYWENQYDAVGEYHDELMSAQRIIGFERIVIECFVTDNGVDVNARLFGPFRYEEPELWNDHFTSTNVVSGLEELGQRILAHAAEIGRKVSPSAETYQQELLR